MDNDWLLPAFIGLVAGISICVVWYFTSKKTLGTTVNLSRQAEPLGSTVPHTYRAVAENEESWEVHRDDKGRALSVTVHRSVKSIG